jgi:hypothetical protein
MNCCVTWNGGVDLKTSPAAVLYELMPAVNQRKKKEKVGRNNLIFNSKNTWPKVFLNRN